jgi:ribosomal protein L37AE/L43A
VIRTCQCPSCGAKVNFRASSTLLAVCEYCQSTLIRTDVDVENIGKMADLLPDSSLLQIGSSGKYKTSQFSVIGRVQYQHESGIWNEWHLLFDNGKTGWLSEASGSFVMSFLSEGNAPIIPLENYKLELTIPILGQRLTVTSIEQARCIAGQGELPFKVQSGFDVTVVDLSNEDAYASLDFSEEPPLLFLGEPVELAALFLSHLREVSLSELKTKTRSFNCPSCAAPVNSQLSQSKTISCKSCSAVLGIENKNVEVLVKSQQALASQISPPIPLGSVGRFEGVDYTNIGYLRRVTKYNGIAYYWNEFLLHHPANGFRWLIASNGHWTFARPLQKSPSVTYTAAHFQDKNYKHFANYEAKVAQVTGEFYWRVKLNDEAVIDDYVNAPNMLSKERIKKEITWTAGEYMTVDEIEGAFKYTFNLPSPSGIAANQPSPYHLQANHWLKTLLSFIAIAFVLQILFAIFSGGRVLLETSVSFQKNTNNTTQLYNEKPLNNDGTEFQSAAFKVTGRASNLMIKQNTQLNNSWLATDVALVEQSTGAVFHAEREAAYYSGTDSDGAWTEDNSRQEIIFSQVPAGDYYLKIEADSDWSDGSKPAVTDYIKVVRDVPQWSNFWFLLLFLLVGPAIYYYMRYRFEVKRWAESDHPIVESE